MEWLDIDKVAKLLKVSTKTALDWAKKNGWKTNKVKPDGSRWYWVYQVPDEFIEARKQEFLDLNPTEPEARQAGTEVTGIEKAEPVQPIAIHEAEQKLIALTDSVNMLTGIVADLAENIDVKIANAVEDTAKRIEEKLERMHDDLAETRGKNEEYFRELRSMFERKPTKLASNENTPAPKRFELDSSLPDIDGDPIDRDAIIQRADEAIARFGGTVRTLCKDAGVKREFLERERKTVGEPLRADTVESWKKLATHLEDVLQR